MLKALQKKMQKRRRSSKPDWQVKIARERITLLFEEAERRVRDAPELSKRYVQLARKIGMRYNVRLPKHLKRQYCNYCYAFLKPGLTSKQFTKNGRIAITCLSCNKTRKTPFR